MNPENGHSDLASGNLHIFKSCSFHLPPPGPSLEQTNIPNQQIFTVRLGGPGPVVPLDAQWKIQR